MLKKCAPGWEMRSSPHKRRFKYRNIIAHLPSKEDEIYVQKVKKFVRDLGIDRKCAEEHLGFSVEL